MKDPPKKESTSIDPQQIAEELEDLAGIFLDGVNDPESLHKDQRGKMDAMQILLTSLIREAVTSGKGIYPKGLLNEVSGKLSHLKGELARFYNKGETPPEETLKKIPELYDLTFTLASQYRKIEG